MFFGNLVPILTIGNYLEQLGAVEDHGNGLFSHLHVVAAQPLPFPQFKQLNALESHTVELELVLFINLGSILVAGAFRLFQGGLHISLDPPGSLQLRFVHHYQL
jgi:hypothetical protein